MLKKLSNYYYDTEVYLCIVKVEKEWRVITEIEGDIRFRGKTLKDCKKYISDYKKELD